MSGVADYEGLVTKTAQMFYEMVGLEFDDMRQELRLKVLCAIRSYDPKRSSMTERAYVYALIANRVKDLKRDAARRANGRLQLTYIEDYRSFANTDALGQPGLHWFEHTFSHTTHDEVYGEVEDGFVMPAGVTDQEQEILLMLVVGYDRTEIAQELGVERADITKIVAQLRGKLADWKPGPKPLPPSSLSPPVIVRQPVAA